MEPVVKIHFCCGDIYLEGYINIDIDGFIVENNRISKSDGKGTRLFLDENPNVTTLDKYFKFPFDPDPVSRQANKRPFVIDKKANILEKWDFQDNSVDEIVMISCFEHFHRQTEIPHIVSEAFRVLKPGGRWLFDFPNIREVVDEYYMTNPELCMELIYCNWKNEFSIHKWGYTPASINQFLPQFKEVICPKQIVQHDYPMYGCIAIKGGE